MKLIPGDIVEIPTPEGNAYVQVTHDHASYPQTVRVLPGRHRERPDNFDFLVRLKSEFVAMVMLDQAIGNMRIKAEKVANTDVPSDYKTFPTFRMPIRDKQGGIAYWWLWDGEGLSYTTELDEKTSDLPMREVMAMDRFMEKLASQA